MPSGPTFEDCCPSSSQRREEWVDVEKLIARIERRNEGFNDVALLHSEWRQIKSLLERVK